MIFSIVAALVVTSPMAVPGLFGEESTEHVLAPASMTGVITFDGEVPELGGLDLSPDPFCVDGNPAGLREHGLIVGADDGLANVFIQLTGVPDEKYDTPDEAVIIDQRGCRYFPHVFGMMKRQDIKILNSDATLHNIHAVPRENREFNVGMPNKGMEIEKTFKKVEDAILIKCDVHPWMKAYAFCLEHPYFAVTDENGKFELGTAGLPDGDYGVKIWHEVLGTATGEVSVSGGAASFDHEWKEQGEG